MHSSLADTEHTGIREPVGVTTGSRSGPNVVKTRSPTKLYSLSAKVATHGAPKLPLKYIRYQRFGTLCVPETRTSIRGMRGCSTTREMSPQITSLSAAGELQCVVAVNGEKPRQLLQSELMGSAADRTASARPCLHPKRLHLGSLRNRRDWARAGTTL